MPSSRSTYAVTRVNRREGNPGNPWILRGVTRKSVLPQNGDRRNPGNPQKCKCVCRANSLAVPAPLQIPTLIKSRVTGVTWVITLKC